MVTSKLTLSWVVLTAASGEYSVSVTVNGCTSPAAKTTATVRANTQIAAQPVAQNACPGSTAAFTVGATGDGAISYRWQKNNVDLVDGGHYSGAASATLTVSNTNSGDVANYRCVVTAGCGSISSGEAAMTLRPVIAADLDGDCDVDATDIEILVSCGSGPAVPHDGSHTCRRADFDSDNDVDPSDFSRLQRCLSGTDASPTPDCMN